MTDNQDIVLKIRVLDVLGNFLGGTVDIRFEHTRLSERPEYRDVDASQEIDIRGLRRAPEGIYKVFVTVADPWKQQGKFVNIPPSGFATLDFVFDQAGEPDGPGDGSFVVLGTVRYPDGRPLAQTLVRAFDRDLRSEEPLGTTTTDECGRYEIRYSAEQFSRLEKASADLVVRAVDHEENELAFSSVFFNAGAEETVDLVVGGEELRGPSEFERLVAELTPLLGNLSLDELTEDDVHRDVTFLSGETGWDAERITLLIEAHRLLEETELEAEVFYGLFRQGLPVSLPGLLVQSADVLRRALVLSAQANIIPPAFADQADAIVESFKDLVVLQALKPGPEGGTATLNDLLSLTLENSQHREQFFSTYIRHQGPIREFWSQLAALPDFGDKVEDLQRSFQLGALTGNHLPLVCELQRMRDSGVLTDLSDLTLFDQDGWLEILARDSGDGPIGAPPGVPGEAADEKKRNYARALSHIVEDAFPTLYVTRRLETDDLSGGEDLLTFFSANPDFNVRTTRLGSYLEEHPDALAGLPEGTEARIRTLQRVYKLAPRYRQASTLIQGGVHSAYSIARMGQNVFIATYRDTLGHAVAKTVYARAQHLHAMALHLAVEYGLSGHKVSLHAVPDGPQGSNSHGQGRLAKSEDAVEVPEWSTLFGSLELCGCDHCRSVYSPAAYLVDVLHFLADRRPESDAKSAKDVLFERRPELGEIELTCQNTNLPLPYVDLINEALENAVAPFAPFAPFELPGDVESDLNSRIASGELRAAFAQPLPPISPPISPPPLPQPPLSDDAVITVGGEGKPWEVEPDWWTIDEPAFTYTIRKEDDQLRVVARSLQTKGTPAERAANPQYVNTKAYDKLAGAVYPCSLPFDLWVAEARTYLGHLGVPRWQLMESFRAGDRPTLLRTDTALAREYLGLTSTQAGLITGAITSQAAAADPGPWNLWGFDFQELSATASIPDPSDSTERITAGQWPDILGERVDVFLQQSGLKYKEMLELLGCHYVVNSQGHSLLITGPDDDPDTCETDKLGLGGLDGEAAARCVRFVRLWRALGWSMRDLDRAITAFAPGDLSGDFLVQLSHVERLHTRFHLPVVRLLSWWADIDCAFYVDHEVAGQPRAASLYDELFRNRATVDPPDPAFTETPDDLAGTLGDHAPTLTAALGVSAAELELLLADPDVVPGDTLTLERLSQLHRHALLARALRLPVRDYLATLRLTDLDPFATTADTVVYVETVDQVRDSGFAIAELDYLLRHAVRLEAPLAPGEEAVAILLDELRAGLQTIAEENTFRTESDAPAGPTTDLDGELTRQKLALLDWPEALIDQVIATLEGTAVYETPLAALPDGVELLPNAPGVYSVELAELPEGFVIPAELRDVVVYQADRHELTATAFLSQPQRELLQAAVDEANDTALAGAVSALFDQQDELEGEIRYDVERQVLGFTGPMTVKRKTRLDAVDEGPGSAYRGALEILYDAPRRFVRRAMRTFAVHDFTAELAKLSEGVELPAALKGRVYIEKYFDHDVELVRLHFLGPMTEPERETLLGFLFSCATDVLPDDLEPGDVPEALQAEFQTRDLELSVTAALAVEMAWRIDDGEISYLIVNHGHVLMIYRASGDTLLTYLFSCATDVMPDGFEPGDVPEALRAQFPAHGLELSDTAELAVEMRRIDDDISYLIVHQGQVLRIYRFCDYRYRLAVKALFDQPEALAITESDAFLDAAVEILFDTGLTAGDRFLHVLRKLLPYLRRTLSERLAVQTLAEALELETRSADALLRTWLASPEDPERSCLDEMLDPAFAESHPNVELTAAAFPGPFKVYTLAHKAAMVVERFELTHQQLSWLFTFTYGPDADWLNLNDLPTGDEDPAAAFADWLRLAELAALRDSLPQGEPALDDLLAAAAVEDKQAWFSAATLWTWWDEADLVTLLGPADDHADTGHLGLAFPYGLGLLVRLGQTFSLLKRLGLSAQQAKDLAADDVTRDSARAVRQAARAKYDEAQWLILAKPLRDLLREEQRAALVAYLIADARPELNVRDAGDLYAHFLIDVEMSPCMMTSRIKQALCSVQLFVQRCLMNLEPEVSASAAEDVKWREWSWMKNYRVWEANRKIFLYAENWIEPELRDDKSPFFVELESELLQSDLTAETAEDAFRQYLEKLDEVARLEPVGIYHELEKDDADNIAVDVLHVFARTPGIPRVYFYRQRVDSAWWTAWERLDLDIEGDHLIPMIWNRRLLLFWPIFTKTANPHEEEIQLAWSERKEDKWGSKLVSSKSIITGSRLGGREAYFFRTSVDAENNLYVTVFWVETSESYEQEGIPLRAFRFDGCHAEPAIDSGAGEAILPITGAHFYRMFLREFQPTSNKLYLPAPTDTVALAEILDNFFLLLPHADGSRLTAHPFFFLDARRTFFVIPSRVKVPMQAFPDLEATDPLSLVIIPEIYWPGPPPDPIDVITDPRDPCRFDSSFPAGNVMMSHARAAGRLAGGAVGGPPTPPGAMQVVGLRAPMVYGAGATAGGATASLPDYNWPVHDDKYRFLFQTFYHPYVCPFVRELNRNGVDGLLQRPMQTHPQAFALVNPDGTPVPKLKFKKEYKPHKVENPIVLEPYPKEKVDFKEDGAYAIYNWELFFHAPLMIADRLSKNQRYEEAQKWFHYIFDPTDVSDYDVPQRYWRTKPFHERTTEDQSEQIQYIFKLLAAGGNPEIELSPGEEADLERLEKAVAAWRKDPFKPHLIARLRATAYQKTVVMKYLDNLIAWADQLFRRDTIESINEATQLYVLAAEILGRRPEDVPPRAQPQVQTFNSLEPQLDAFSNALVAIEDSLSPADGVPTGAEAALPTLSTMLYFCVPKNDMLLGYWDTVADRLFKIRHCMNIEGVVRQLPLFEPPIDPALLVKAAAAGVDFGSVLNDLSAGPPHYRFNVLAQKATELCGELKSLGQAMLSALEKRDAEKLSLLRAEHETTLLALVEEVRELQVDEAEQNRTALEKSRETAISRYLHYQKLLGVQEPKAPELGAAVEEGQPSEHVAIKEEDGFKMISWERAEMSYLKSAYREEDRAADKQWAANVAHSSPNISIGVTSVGGSNVGFAFSGVAESARAFALRHRYHANQAAKLGQIALRAHDWLLQSNLAGREIMQIDQQILAADLRIAITERELENHRHQLEQAREVQDFLSDKYTHQELYGWMIGQLSTVYFQTYQLAYDLAKRAERAFRHELGLKDSSYIQFGYWDSLKKGLLAGERLFHDLKRMEVAYLEKNRREYEITKHASLAQLDPLALIQLRQTGACVVGLPEALFDLDFPGHTMRRLKSVSLSIPCVTGPYTGVHCTLTLLKSSVRHGNTLLDEQYARQEGDPRFTDYLGTIQSIVTSIGQNDSGLFETNLRDERYLPFEGAGAISEWRIELPKTFRQFDYDTISDVILHLRYTAREGGGLLKQQATLELTTALDEFLRSGGQQGLAQIFSLRHEFPGEWHHFLNPPAAESQALTMPLEGRFPFFLQGKTVTIKTMELFVKVDPKHSGDHNESTLKLFLKAGTSASAHAVPLALWNGLLRGEASGGLPDDWTLTGWLDASGEHERIDPGAIQDILVVCHYTCD